MTAEQITEKLNQIRVTLQACQTQLIRLMDCTIGCATACEQLMGEVKKLEEVTPNEENPTE